MALQLISLEPIRVKDSDLPVPNGDPEVVYTLRPLTGDVYRQQQALRLKAIQEHGAENVSSADLWLLNYCLTEWEGMYYAGGVDVAPCNDTTRQGLDVFRVTALVNAAGMNKLRAAEVRREASF